jgi:predicted AlkP superfamily pyrophosphatase or phosphodiesterase
VIVRISGEDQYRLPDADAARLNELDNAVVELVEGGREDGYADAFAALLAYVREHGEPIGDVELEGSDLILPPSDLTFEEAGSEFSGEGLIPE